MYKKNRQKCSKTLKDEGEICVKSRFLNIVPAFSLFVVRERCECFEFHG